MSSRTLLLFASAALLAGACQALSQGTAAIRAQGEGPPAPTQADVEGAASASTSEGSAETEGIAAAASASDGESDGAEVSSPQQGAAVGPPTLTFRAACRLPEDNPATTGAVPSGMKGGDASTPQRRVLIGALGDILLHVELQKQGLAAKNGFSVIWASVEDLLARPDITYANLETPLAAGVGRDGEELTDPGRVYDGKVYSSYPRFNVHPSLATALVKSGFDVVSTANNHALDRGPLGVDRTISALAHAKLAYTGTRDREHQRAGWHTVIKSGDYRIAFVACTRHVNGREDPEGQVLRCDRQAKELKALIRKLAGDAKIHAVIVTPHWGDEYSHDPNEQQRRWAAEWIESGALAVIGNHPHVLQPWERIIASDGREGIAIYSLGNFASHQPELAKRSTALAVLELRPDGAGRLALTGAGYVPLTVRQDGSSFFVESVERARSPVEIRDHITSILGSGNALPAEGPWRMPLDCRE